MELIGTMKAKIGVEYNLKSSVQFFVFGKNMQIWTKKNFLKNTKTFRKKTKRQGDHYKQPQIYPKCRINRSGQFFWKSRNMKKVADFGTFWSIRGYSVP